MNSTMSGSKLSPKAVSFVQDPSGTSTKSAELDVVRQLVREELQVFAREHLSQISSCVEQTAKLVREQVSSPLHTSSRSTADTSAPSWATHHTKKWHYSALLNNIGQANEPTRSETAASDVGRQGPKRHAPPLTFPEGQPDEPTRCQSSGKFAFPELKRATTPFGFSPGFDLEGDLASVDLEVDTPKSTWSSRARKVAQPKRPARSISLSSITKSDEAPFSSLKKVKPEKVTRLVSLHQPLFSDVHLAPKKYAERSSGITGKMDTVSEHDEGCCMRLVQAPLFVYIICVAILANAVTIGVQTEYMATHLTTRIPTIFYLLEGIFCVFFTLEIIFRLCAYGCLFFRMPEWQWNMFDIFVVLVQLFDNGISLVLYSNRDWSELDISENTDGFTVLYLLRIFRLLRILRLARMVHIVGELQAIIVAVTSSLRSLAWIVVLLVLLIYMLGVSFTQIVTDHLVLDPPHKEQLQESFGSLGSSMMSLFEAISDGVEWREVYFPLTPNLRILFVMYIAFSAFAFMNMLTGIFVDKALESGKSERRRFLLEAVLELFHDGDHIEETGKITWPDFQAHLNDSSMQSILHAIDVDQDDAHELFHLLDTHHDGAIEVGEFVNGCLSLDGPAKAIDLAAFAQETRYMNQKWIHQAQFVNTCLVQLQNMVMSLDQLNTFVRAVSGGSNDIERMESF